MMVREKWEKWSSFVFPWKFSSNCAHCTYCYILFKFFIFNRSKRQESLHLYYIKSTFIRKLDVLFYLNEKISKLVNSWNEYIIISDRFYTIWRALDVGKFFWPWKSFWLIFTTELTTTQSNAWLSKIHTKTLIKVTETTFSLDRPF